jgi:hypothetical protein
MTTISPHTTRANGTILTATIYNTDHSNHIANAQALNSDKVEGATPPVVDGNAVVFDGTSGAAIRDSGSAPVLEDDLPLAVALGGTGATSAADARTNLGVPAATVGQGKHTIWIPATAMKPGETAGATTSDYDSGTQDHTIGVLDFDQTTAEHAFFTIAMPKSWNVGTFTFIPYWTAAAGSGTVQWFLQAVARGDDDALDTAVGTAVTSDDTLISTGDLHVGPESSAMTASGTPAANDLVVFKLGRQPANDTLTGDAKLIGIKLIYTTNAATDD